MKTKPKKKPFCFSSFHCSPPEHNVITVPEREKEPDGKTRDHNMSENSTRNRGYSGLKSEVLKPENPLKQNSGYPCDALNRKIRTPLTVLFLTGVCPSRSRRRCGAIERRAGGLSESGSDSGSSSGSVRASRGSWGSWSSASSMEGDKDHGARTHACTTSYRKSKYTSIHNFFLSVTISVRSSNKNIKSQGF